MTAKELIEALSKLPPDVEIMRWDDEFEVARPIKTLELKEWQDLLNQPKRNRVLR